MKLNFKFRNMKRSEELMEYVEDRFSKLEKFEWKPITINVTFSAQRHDCCTDVYIHGSEISFRAEAKCSGFHEAIDLVVAKLTKQLARKKARIQDHLVYENSRLGKMDRVTSEEANDTAMVDEPSYRRTG